MVNLVLNPITGEWEYLTPHQWANLKCGLPKDSNTPSWKHQFILNSNLTSKKYMGAENHPNAHLYLFSMMLKLGISKPEDMYKFCLWVSEKFELNELESFIRPIYEVRRKINDLSSLRSERSSGTKRSKRSNC